MMTVELGHSVSQVTELERTKGTLWTALKFMIRLSDLLILKSRIELISIVFLDGYKIPLF